MRPVVLGLLACGTSAVGAGDFAFALDLRAVSSDGRPSFLENGRGKLRYDADHEGVQLGRLRAAWDQPLGEVFALHAEASAWDDDDKNPVVALRADESSPYKLPVAILNLCQNHGITCALRTEAER